MTCIDADMLSLKLGYPAAEISRNMNTHDFRCALTMLGITTTSNKMFGPHQERQLAISNPRQWTWQDGNMFEAAFGIFKLLYTDGCTIYSDITE